MKRQRLTARDADSAILAEIETIERTLAAGEAEAPASEPKAKVEDSDAWPETAEDRKVFATKLIRLAEKLMA